MPGSRADNTVKKQPEQTGDIEDLPKIPGFKYARRWVGPTEQKVLVLVRVLAKSQKKAENIVEKELGWLQDPRIVRSEIAHLNRKPAETDDHCPTCTCNK